MTDEVGIHYSEFDDVNLSQIDLQVHLGEEASKVRSEDLTQFDPHVPVFSQPECVHTGFSQEFENIPSPVLDAIRSNAMENEQDLRDNALQDELHPGLKNSGSSVKRRGPMDNMRQLVRILITLMPQSESLLDASVNVLKEEAVRQFLDRVLGDAPRPCWGTDAWAEYLSSLFSWVRSTMGGKNIEVTPEQARLCADRLPGRCWTINEECLKQLDLSPCTWVLPLSKTSFAKNQRDAQEEGLQHSPKRRRGSKRAETPVTVAGQDIASMSELEVLQWIDLFSRIAKTKARRLVVVGSERPNASECDMIRNKISLMMSEDWESSQTFAGGSQNHSDQPNAENK